jgi:hypothetical protein
MPWALGRINRCIGDGISVRQESSNGRLLLVEQSIVDAEMELKEICWKE